jgi:trans-AT polyketide synthase/acyltransferase/oxidoreductase domain-containing protein
MHYDWSPHEPPALDAAALAASIERLREPVALIQQRATGFIAISHSGDLLAHGSGDWALLGLLPPAYPEWLGDRTFNEVHRTRFPYVTGAMANGIASADLVVAAARAGLLSFFGAAGLPLHEITRGLDAIQAQLVGEPWGVNLIHSPNEPALEAACAAEIIRRGVSHVEASAYMALTPALVVCALSGLRQSPDGHILRPRHIFAKISRPEVARHFLSPAPQDLLDQLVASGQLTPDEARLARHIPLANDITVEADSGGHTDNQPLPALFPVIAAQRDMICAAHQYQEPVRVGAAGGLGDPSAVAAAFALGAAYVVTGSVNQACVESGLSPAGKNILAQVGIGDVMMAPAADMFELGVKLQVVRRGTMFGPRAQKLYDLWRAYNSWAEIPEADRERVERTQLRAPFEQVWEQTRAFFAERDPEQLERAEHDSKHQMALVFRWYLGKSSRWANAGEPERAQDYQIWCGPAMASFNQWVAGSFMEPPEQRRVAQVALNLMEGAARITRAQQLRALGAPLPPAAMTYAPRPLSI